jgi:hypothetical protein
MTAEVRTAAVLIQPASIHDARPGLSHLGTAARPACTAHRRACRAHEQHRTRFHGASPPRAARTGGGQLPSKVGVLCWRRALMPL